MIKIINFISKLPFKNINLFSINDFIMMSKKHPLSEFYWK